MMSISIARCGNFLPCLLALAATAHASEDVAIEVPEATKYALNADRMTIEDASGERTETEHALLALCGDGQLCPPFAATALPLKVSAHGPIHVNDRSLQGTLWLMMRGSKLLLVNRLPLEEYLVATVGSEMPRTFPLEALKAQAVAARTYALSRKIAREGEAVHMSATTLDQVYGGLEHESDETRAAVNGTLGEVLVFERQPIEALFFSSCSGQTRDGPVVFPQAQSYLKSVPCPACKLGAAAKWKQTYTLAELTKKLGVGPVKRLRLEGQTEDGRPKDVVIEPSGQRIPPEQLRKRLGYTQVKSASFTVTCTDAACELNGLGYGHGVGMCQYGARSLALEGHTYKDILSHYYPGVALKKLY